MSKVIPMEPEQQDYEFTPLAEAVMDALDVSGDRTVAEIALEVGEPCCVVHAMLNHLAQDGMVIETTPKKKRRRTR